MLQSICDSIVQLSRRNSINSSMFEFVAMILIACILAIIRLLGKCNLQHYLQHLHGFLWRVRRPAVITDDRLRKKKKNRKIICDRCKKTLVYQGQTICHLGNFIHAPPKTAISLSDRVKAWERGEWNATYYCTECLAVFHKCTPNIAFNQHCYHQDELRRQRKAYWKESMSDL